ncbi:xanthine dehydrogenase family protein molybdopterin-binding subunit [Chloroflexota bacterium]
MEDKYSVIGKSVPNIDALDKVTGRAKYGIDLKMDAMLYAKMLRSPYPHARVVKIDTTKAESHPKVRAIVTINEVPKVIGTVGKLRTEEGRKSLYIRDNIVRFIGDPVAAVAAEDEESALEALSLIDVKYEQLPTVFDPLEAMKEESVKIHEGGNIAFNLLKEFGDIDQGFEKADYIFEDRFVTSRQKHCAMEPFSSCIADYSLGGRLTVYSSSQRPHIIKVYLAGALGLPVDRVRIIKPYTGGAFGGRDYLIHGLEAMCSFLSRKTGKPVKMTFTREEDFEATESRHPFIIELKFGVNNEGILTAMSIKAVMDMGGYGPHAIGVLSQAIRKGTALYRCPNVKCEGYSVYTNKSLCGAYRGYGNPQMNFAIESLMDMVAEKLDIDPLELRLKNYRGLGEIEPMTGDEIRSDGMKDCLIGGARKFDWSGRKERRFTGGMKRRGTGMSCLVHHSGGRFGAPDPASAMIMFNLDGSVSLVTGAADDGQGNRTVLAQIAAEELGVAFEQVSLSDTDTEVTPVDSGTHGSRQTYAGGIAVQKAAAEAKANLLGCASKRLNVGDDKLRVKEGVIYDAESPERNIRISDLLRQMQFEDLSDGRQIIGFATGVAPSSPPIFGVNFVEVEVDIETGEVRILKLTCAFDVGKAINPAQVDGQVTGGEVMGIGYALTEGLVTTNGRIMNGNFTDYRILRACDVPEMEVIVVESNEPTGAFGAKGVGEATMAGTASAVANAVYDAVGVRVKELPITQEKILEGLRLTGKR